MSVQVDMARFTSSSLVVVSTGIGKGIDTFATAAETPPTTQDVSQPIDSRTEGAHS